MISDLPANFACVLMEVQAKGVLIKAVIKVGNDERQNGKEKDIPNGVFKTS